MNPEVSVVVPIYGVEKYLRQCVDSILAQTLKEIEIILVDDGSPDGCPAIIDEYAAKDSRIIPVHQPNGGYGKAVNHGIELAKGEYIGIVEPDDWIEPEMYSCLYRRACQDNLDVVKSNFKPIYIASRFSKSEPNRWPQAPAEDKILTTEEAAVFFWYHPSIWTCIYKRDFLNMNQIRMGESPAASWQDNPFQIQTLCLAQRIGFTRKAFYNYRIFASSDSAALKNWRTPFERTREIHDWLKANGYNRPPITSWLGLRELAYLQIVAGMKKTAGWAECAKAIRELAQTLPIDEMLALFPFKKRSEIKRKYRLANVNPNGLRFLVRMELMRNRLRGFRRWFTSVRIRGGLVKVVFLGRTFLLAFCRKSEEKID